MKTPGSLKDCTDRREGKLERKYYLTICFKPCNDLVGSLLLNDR